MKTKLQFQHLYADDSFGYNEPYALVNWSLLEPYWVREDFAGIPDRNKLSGYLEDWFSDGLFKPGCIGWCDRRRSLSFTNGRHRVALISKHQDEVPVILSEQSILQPEIQKAVIRILYPDDEIELPDLGFVQPVGRIPVIGEGINTWQHHE